VPEHNRSFSGTDIMANCIVVLSDDTGNILKEGLVDYRSEEELERNARRAYANYLATCFKPTWPVVSPVHYLRVVRKAGAALLDRVSRHGPIPKRVPPQKVAMEGLTESPLAALLLIAGVFGGLAMSVRLDAAITDLRPIHTDLRGDWDYPDVVSASLISPRADVGPQGK
jgi:hypothetical protein